MSGLLRSVQAALIDGREVSLHELLYRIKIDGNLSETFHGAILSILISEAAERAGLVVTEDEAQSEADRIRTEAGLYRASDTRMWLKNQDLSEEDFEASVVERVLTAKLRAKLTGTGVRAYFEENRADFDSDELDEDTSQQIVELLWTQWLQNEVDRRKTIFVLPSIIAP